MAMNEGPICKGFGYTFLLIPTLFVSFWTWWVFKHLSPYSNERVAYVEDGEWAPISRLAEPMKHVRGRGMTMLSMPSKPWRESETSAIECADRQLYGL